MALSAAERQRARRARMAAARASVEELAAGREEAAQVGLPLAPVVEHEVMPPLPPSGAGGRPAGSVARKTAEWQRYMLERYRSPLVVLAEVYSRTTDELAQQLGCTRLEAFDRQLKAAIEVAPYIHSKMPAAVQLDGAPVAPVTLMVSDAMAARLGIGQSEPDQGLGGSDPA